MPAAPRQFLPLRLRRAFDRRTERLAQAGFLLREVDRRMHERIEMMRITPARIVDLGCASGGSFTALSARYAQAQLVGVDASAPMLRAARAYSGWLARVAARLAGRRAPQLIQADWAQLPLRDGCADLVWSNLALHWAAEPHRVLPEWARLVGVGGLLMFSCFGPDTFAELRAALADVDGAPHVIDFVDMHDLGDMLGAAGLADPVMDVERLTLTYASPAGLLADVRALGIYPGADGFTGLRGRRWRAALEAALERRRGADGQIALSLELIYGHAWKPAPRVGAPDQHGVATLRPDQIGRGPRRGGPRSP